MDAGYEYDWLLGDDKETSGLGDYWQKIKGLGKKAFKKVQDGLDFVRGDDYDLPEEINLYYLPIYDSDDHAIVIQEDIIQDRSDRSIYKKIGQYLFRPLQAHTEEIYKALNDVEVINFHYADSLDQEIVRDDYLEHLSYEGRHHKTYIPIDAVVGTVLSIIPLPLGIFVLPRAADHASALNGIKHLANDTEYIDDAFLSELEEIMGTSTSKTQAYSLAAELAKENEFDDIAKLYESGLIDKFGPRRHYDTDVIHYAIGKIGDGFNYVKDWIKRRTGFSDRDAEEIE